MAALAIVGGVARVGWQRRERANQAVVSAGVDAARAKRDSLASAAASPVPPAPTPSVPAAAAPAIAGSAASIPIALPPEIQRTVTDNLVPGRMVFLDFVLTSDGLRVVGATGAAGRAKSLEPRAGFGFVHYEVFGAGGELLLRGSVEDPTRRRLEHPAASDDGRIASTVQWAEEGPLAVRLPGEIPAARISFFRDRNPLAPASGRDNLGEFWLRPQP